MAGLSLHQLVESIAGAVADAQSRLHRFQVAALEGYFDENLRPRAVNIRLPSLSQQAEAGDERIVSVPILAMVQPQPLAITEMEIEFDVGLTGLDDADPPTPADGDGKTAVAGAASTTNDLRSPLRPPQHLGVDLSTSPSRTPGMTARVKLKVEAREPPEGLARLIQHLDKYI